MVAGDPSAPDFKVQNLGLTPDMATRLDDRVHLLQGMDRLRRDLDGSGLMNAMDRFSQRAVTMLTSPGVRDAFDLSREPAAVRERYARITPSFFLKTATLIRSGGGFVVFSYLQSVATYI